MGMTQDVFKVEFKRLCEGFSYQPRPAQVAAFYDRLQHVHEADWREAVTDLLCAPYFPKTIEVMLDAVEKRADQRRRGAVHRERVQAERIVNAVSLREAMQDKPELMAPLKRILNL
jgi:hypothetical protein